MAALENEYSILTTEQKSLEESWFGEAFRNWPIECIQFVEKLHHMGLKDSRLGRKNGVKWVESFPFPYTQLIIISFVNVCQDVPHVS